MKNFIPIQLDTIDPPKNFEVFRETLSENDKRCYFGVGTVMLEDSLAIIELKMNHGKWEILLDFKNYMKGSRKKKKTITAEVLVW